MEWLLEGYNPDSETGEGDRPRWSVLLRFALAVGIVVAFVVYGLPLLRRIPELEPWMIAAAVAVYLLVAFFMKPRIDPGELEWWNLIIDNPFTIDDDIDRMWFFVHTGVLLLFLPGIVVTHGTYEFIIMVYKAL